MDLTKLSDEDLKALAKNDFASISERGLRIIAGETPPEPKEGIGAAVVGGTKRALSTGRTGLEALFSPEEAARKGVERAEELGQQYAPGASLEAVKQAYAERGLLGGAGEAISQIPTALAEQFPQIAATLGGARAGAMAGARFGPKGALIGGIGGAVAPSALQLFGANIERQAAEQMEAGEPLDISRTRAAAAAAPGAALEVAATFIPLGRTIVGKVLGPGAEQALARGSTEAAERLAKEGLTKTLAKGVGVGAAAEIPTEVIQQMLERAQAGLPLTSEDALAEYGEAAYGAGLVGGPFGAVGRVGQRSVARGEVAEREAAATAEEQRLAAEEAQAEEERAAAEAEAETARKTTPEYRQELNSQIVDAKDRLREIEGVLKDKTLDEDVKKEAIEEAKTLRKTIGDLNKEMKESMKAAGQAPTLEQALAKQKEAVETEPGVVYDEYGLPVKTKTKPLTEAEEAAGYELQAARVTAEFEKRERDFQAMQEKNQQEELRRDKALQEQLSGFIEGYDELQKQPYGPTEFVKSEREKQQAQEITLDRMQLALDKFTPRLLGLKPDETVAKLQAEYDRLSDPEAIAKTRSGASRTMAARENYMGILSNLENKLRTAYEKAAPNSRQGYDNALANGFVNRFVTSTLGIKGLGGRTLSFNDALPQVEARIAELEEQRQQAITSKDPLMSDKGQLTFAGEKLVVNEAKLNELKRIVEGARAQAPEETGAESAVEGTLQAATTGPTLVAPDLEGLPTSTLKGKLDNAKKQSTGAFLDLTSYLDDYRAGRFFGPKGAKRDIKFASSTRAELLRDSEEARRRVIDNLINEIATERAIQKQRPLTKTEATALGIRADKILGELVDRSTALPSGAVLKEVVIQPARVRGTEIIESAKTALVDPRLLEERQFGAPERAVEVLAEMLNQLRDQTIAEGKRPVLASYATDLIGSRPRDTKKSDAQLDVEDRIIEDVGQILPTLDPDSEAFRTLDEAATTLANEDVSRDFVDLVGEQVQRIRQGTDEATDPQLLSDIRSALDAQRAGREFAAEEGQQAELFGDTRATVRSTPAQFERLQKSAKVTKERERIAKEKADIEQTRKVAIQAKREVDFETSVEGVKKKEQELLDRIQMLAEQIKEQEGYDEISVKGYKWAWEKSKDPKEVKAYKEEKKRWDDATLEQRAKMRVPVHPGSWKIVGEGRPSKTRKANMSQLTANQFAVLDDDIKKEVKALRELEQQVRKLDAKSEKRKALARVANRQKQLLSTANKARTKLDQQQKQAETDLMRTLQKAQEGLDLPGIRAQRKSREELAKEIGEARAEARKERKAAKAAGKTAEEISAIKAKMPSRFKIARIKDRSEILNEQRAAATRTRTGVSVVENLKAIEQQEATAVANLQKAKKDVKDWTSQIQEASTAVNQKLFKQYEPQFYAELDRLARIEEVSQTRLDTIRANKKMFSELEEVQYKTKPSPRERTTTGETKPAGLGVTEQQMYEYGVFGMAGGVKIKTSNPPEFAIGDSDPTGEIDVAEAKKFLADVKAKAAKQGIKVKIYPITEVMSPDLYGASLAALGPEAARRVKGGVEPNGDVFFVIESHSTLEDLKATVAHELIGHYTFEGMLGEKGLKRLLNRLEKTYGNISKLAEKIGGQPLLRKVHQAEAMMKKLGKSDDEVRMRGLNELVAYTMEKRVDQDFLTRAKQWLQELVGALRLGLRELGIDMGGMSTSELFYLMRQADRNFKAGKPVARIESDGTVKYSVADSAVDNTGINKMIAQRGKYFDDAKGLATGMFGLAGRVQFLDRFAALEAVMKKAVSAGAIDSLKAFDAMYFSRMADQRNNFVAQFATGGVGKIVTKNGERMYDGGDGPSLKEVSEALVNSGVPANRVEVEFTGYIAALRAKQIPGGIKKLSTEGKVTEAEINQKIAQYANNAAFQKARKLYQEYNNNLIDFVLSSGAITKELASKLKGVDYIPFYRAKGNDVFLEVMGEQPIRIGDIKNQPHLQQLLGGQKQILPIFTSALSNTSVLTDLALKNMATANTADALRMIGVAKINKGQGPANPDVIRFKVDGQDFHAVVDTQAKSDLFGNIPTELVVQGMEGIKATLPVGIRLLGAPANWLRKFVTRDPRYAFRQIFRDSMAAAMTTGADFVPVVQTFKDMATMKKTGALQTLQKRGVVGGQVISGAEDDMGKILQQVASGKPGWNMAMAKLDELAMMGDAATRVSMYNAFLKQGLSEREATFATLEAMNFSRRGISPSVLYANTLIPFFNAALQGLDVLYRAYKGDMPASERLRVKQKLIARLGIMAGITLAYAYMMQDDETYENANPEERYGNWFVPTPFGTLRVPIPFELGLIGKALPEGVYRLMASDDSTGEVADALRKMAVRSIPIDIPTAIKPAIEWNMNRSFFTGRDIVLASMPDDPRFQYSLNTPEIIKLFGNIGLPPVKVENTLRGYTGSLGVSMLRLLDPVFGGEVVKAGQGLANVPIAGGLFQPEDASGIINAAYNTANNLEGVIRTYKRLQVEDPKSATEYYNDNVVEISMASTAGQFKQYMGQITAEERKVRASTAMTPEQKDKRLKELRQMKIDFAKQFRQREQTLRQAA